MTKYKCDIVTEKLTVRAHYLAIWILNLLFWLLILGHTLIFKGLNLVSFYFWGKVIEICARTNIIVKEVRVCTFLPPWAFIFGKANGV